MIIVGNTIVSDDIADCRFSCDLACCRGACCIEGDSGAPLREEEVPILEAILPEVEPYMTPEGREAVHRQGVAVRDKDGDLGTPLLGLTPDPSPNGEGGRYPGSEATSGACAYAIQENGLTLCAIEKAYRENQNLVNSEKLIVNRKETTSLNSQFTIHNSASPGVRLPGVRLNFPKPVSCHLYPIRVEDYGEFTAVNYHQWDICKCAKGHGESLYKYLKEPLIRRFGQEWYDELLQEINNRNAKE